MEDFSVLDAIAISRGSRKPHNSQPTLSYVRDLELSDLPNIQAPEPSAAPGSVVKQMKQTHHLLAMALASGAKDIKAAQLTGYSPSTVSSLKSDPTFKQLIEHYANAELASYEELKQRAAALGLSFLDELQQRFEDKPEAFDNKSLMDNATKLLDRTIMPSKAGQGVPPPPAGPPQLPSIVFINAPSSLDQPNLMTIEAKAKP